MHAADKRHNPIQQMLLCAQLQFEVWRIPIALGFLPWRNLERSVRMGDLVATLYDDNRTAERRTRHCDASA